MKLDKFDVMLCLAYQGSEGPLDVRVDYTQHSEWLNLTKDQIDQLSDIDAVHFIAIEEPRSDRRWRQRGSKERRS